MILSEGENRYFDIVSVTKCSKSQEQLSPMHNMASLLVSRSAVTFIYLFEISPWTHNTCFINTRSI